MLKCKLTRILEVQLYKSTIQFWRILYVIETSYRIEFYFPVLNHLYILFLFVKRVKLCLVKYMISLLEIWKQSKLYFMKNYIVLFEMDLYLTTTATATACLQDHLEQLGSAISYHYVQFRFQNIMIPLIRPR